MMAPAASPSTWRRSVVLVAAVVSVTASGTVGAWYARQPTGVIEGRVLTPDGSSAAGISISALLLYSEREDSRVFRLVGGAVTDREGRFRIPNLAPAPYFLKAERDYDADIARVPIFYPSEASPRRALPIQLAAGETVRRDIKLRYVQPFPITGELLDSRGRPIAGETRVYGTMRLPSIDLTYERVDTNCCSDSRHRFILEVDGRGRFRTTPLPPGKYVFRTGLQGVAVAHESDFSHVVLQIHERATIGGRVTPPLSASEYKEAIVGAYRTDGVWDSRGNASLSADGTFSLGLAPGTFLFQFWLPHGWAPQAVRLSDGRNVIDEPITVKPAESVEGVVVEVVPEARIEGSIAPPDMLGAYGSEVIVFPARREHWKRGSRFIHQFVLDRGESAFAVGGVVPGMDYLVAVQPVGALRPLKFSDWLEELSKSAVKVPAPKAGTYRADIHLEKLR